MTVYGGFVKSALARSVRSCAMSPSPQVQAIVALAHGASHATCVDLNPRYACAPRRMLHAYRTVCPPESPNLCSAIRFARANSILSGVAARLDTLVGNGFAAVTPSRPSPPPPSPPSRPPPAPKANRHMCCHTPSSRAAEGLCAGSALPCRADKCFVRCPWVHHAANKEMAECEHAAAHVRRESAAPHWWGACGFAATAWLGLWRGGTHVRSCHL